jgi:type IV secretion system protein VirB2
MNKSIIKKISQVAIVALLVMAATNVSAAGSGMPWEGPLQKILDSFAGPVAKIIGVLAIILTGCAMAFGEGGGGMKKLIQIVFGLSIAFTAASFGLTFFGFAGGCAF